STFRVFILQLPLVYLASILYDLQAAFMLISASNMIAGVIGYFWIEKAIKQLREA
ncbi:MAG: MATE family efflux transporter, partial [Kordiimonadaceae bacterium]|nr:MATE family efflux transporter [Kordiimonadaceae bacterium]